MKPLAPLLAAACVAAVIPSAVRAEQRLPLFQNDTPMVDVGDLSLAWNAPSLVAQTPSPTGTRLAPTTLTLDAAAPAASDANASSEAELSKKINNPVADLISVPLQYNADFGIGTTHTSRSTLNIQPVIPITLNQDWNLISRTIVPVIYADSPASGISTNWGLGDTTQSFFFSPKKEIGGWILGVGPALLLPTATDTGLGSGKWGAGPTGVALRQEHGWTYGVLANHIWSFAGDGDRSAVNATYVQPFLTYSFPTFTTVGINTETTYNWEAEQFTVPINLFVTQILKIDKLPVAVSLGGRYYAEGPSGGPEWGMRFVFTFLFPK